MSSGVNAFLEGGEVAVRLHLSGEVAATLQADWLQANLLPEQAVQFAGQIIQAAAQASNLDEASFLAEVTEVALEKKP